MKLSKDLVQIAMNLRSARIESGLDADALAKATGTSEAHIRQIENGEAPSPSLTWLERAADAMRVPLSRLLDLDPVEIPDDENRRDGKEDGRRRTCRWALPEFDGTATCRNPDAKDRQTVDDAACQACAAYSSRYIQYPWKSAPSRWTGLRAGACRPSATWWPYAPAPKTRRSGPILACTWASSHGPSPRRSITGPRT